MKLIDLVNFLKSPADREVIARWTPPEGPRACSLELPPPPDPERFVFLALGDTGDSAGSSAQESPQDAVARFMADDTALPGTNGDGQLVLHMGDVVYMTGERRLYDRNFRRPYAALLTPESTVDNLVFRVPFLPVPGNHDYYDFSGWATKLARMPFVGAGVAAIARELFAFQIPVGGSDQGAAYMDAFVDRKREPRDGPLPYQPGVATRIPHRYYRFSVGAADFFALDSNTLDAPPPDVDLTQERKEAAARVKELEKKARALNREIERDEQAVDRWLITQRETLAGDAARVASLQQAGAEVGTALGGLSAALGGLQGAVPVCAAVAEQAGKLRDRWAAALADLSGDGQAAAALAALDEVSDDRCELVEALEECFAELPQDSTREALLAARDRVLEAGQRWRQMGTGSPPPDLCGRLKELTVSLLDVQRHLALERRRMGRQPEDYDTAQIEWLRNALDESVRDNPDGWRIVFLHQPLYTTIGDHSENSDVTGVRANLIPLFRDRVHLVLAGHAHAFEWFRSNDLPTTGLIVTGGGGQPWLWRSILDPRRFRQLRHLYRSLRESGATECVAAGNGPAAADGEAGALYHYVRVEVTPEALTVVPVGVRRAAGRYRRECPMPVFHVPEFPADEPRKRPPWNPRILEAIEIRRGEAPRPRWK